MAMPRALEHFTYTGTEARLDIFAGLASISEEAINQGASERATCWNAARGVGRFMAMIDSDVDGCVRSALRLANMQLRPYNDTVIVIAIAFIVSKYRYDRDQIEDLYWGLAFERSRWMDREANAPY